MIIVSRRFWLVTVSDNEDIIRIFKGIRVKDAKVIAQDAIEQLETEISCTNAINDAVKIANGI